MTTYSQNDEEKTIANHLDLTKPGKYLDIGAGEPTYLSNTYMLYTKGWSGLCVDGALSDRYKDQWKALRPRDIFIDVMILDKECDIQCHGGIVSGSAFYKAFEEDMRPKGLGPSQSRHAISFTQLLLQYPEFNDCDFFSMDVECCEERILSVVDFNVFKPKLMIIEYIAKEIDYRSDWEKYVLPWYNRAEDLYGNQAYLRK